MPTATKVAAMIGGGDQAPPEPPRKHDAKPQQHADRDCRDARHGGLETRNPSRCDKQAGRDHDHERAAEQAASATAAPDAPRRCWPI